MKARLIFRNTTFLFAASLWLAIPQYVTAQETDTAPEAEAENQFEAEVDRLLATIGTTREQGQWQKTLDASDQLEKLFDENGVWEVMEEIDLRSVRRNIAMWRADALVGLKRLVVAKAQYDQALSFTENSNDDGEIAKYLENQLQQLAILEPDQYALDQLKNQDRSGFTEEQKTGAAELEKMMGHLSEIRKAYSERRWKELEFHADAIEAFFAKPEIIAESDPSDLDEMIKYVALFRADGAMQLGRLDRAEEQYGIALGFFEKSEPGSIQTITTKIKLASLYRERGKAAKALSLFETIEGNYRKNFPTDDRNFAALVGQIGETHFVMGNLKDAETRFFESLNLLKKVRDPLPMDTELARVNLAKAYLGQGRWSEAEAGFRAALKNLRPLVGDDHDHVATALSGLVTIYSETGRGAQAELFARQSLATLTRSRGQDYPGTIQAVSNLAVSLIMQNRLSDAEVYLRGALDRSTTALGTDHALTALTSSNLGTALMRQDRFAEALPHLHNAKKWHTSASGAGHPEISTYQNNIAATLTRLGRYDEAALAARDSIRSLEKLYGVNHPKLAISWANLGSILFLGNRDRNNAIEAFDRALSISENIPGLPGWATIESLNGISLVLGSADPTNNRALDAGRKAVTLLREQRERRYDANNQARKAGAMGMDTQNEAGSHGQHSFSLLVKLLTERSEAIVSERAKNSEEIFALTQDAKLSGAARAMAQTAARTASGEGELASLVRQQQDLSRELVARDSELEKALVAGDLDRKDLVQKIVEEKAKALAAVNKSLNDTFPQYTDLVSPKPLAIGEVQARLDENDGLLLLHSGLQDIVLFAITKRQALWKRMDGTEKEVQNRITRLRCQIDPQGCAEDYFVNEQMSDAEIDGYRAYDRKAAYYLYQQLVEPVESLFEGKEHIYVVSSGALATLPLAALVAGEPDEGDDADPEMLAKTMWLGDRYAFTSLPAVSALRGIASGLPQNGVNKYNQNWRFTGFGAPLLDGPAEQISRSRGTGASGFFRAGGEGLSLADPSSIKKLVPLPGTDRELEAMAKALNADAQDIVTGAGATEAAVRSSDRLANSEVVIFATHGLLPEELEGLDEPALVFTPPEIASRLDDGVLSASEATELKMNARWVILSACNTASAEGQGGGDSLSSLSRAFLYAGAKSLLASNWRVGDEETALLTVETIKADRAAPDRGRAKALKNAMKIVRTGKRANGLPVEDWNPEWVHPASWASFIHISNAP